jgi:hypothetical protein
MFCRLNHLPTKQNVRQKITEMCMKIIMLNGPLSQEILKNHKNLMHG